MVLSLALWFLLRDVFCCHALLFVFVFFSVLFNIVTKFRLGKRELVVHSFVILHASIFVPFLFLLVSGIDCGL